MLTKDLKVGMHIAWSYQSRNSYGDNQEAFIMAFRPRGGRYSSVGNNTVGIARTWGRYDNGTPQAWSYDWISPAQVKQTWEAELVERAERQKRAEERLLEQKREKARRKAVVARINPRFLEALGLNEGEVDDYLRGYRSSFYINLDKLEAAYKIAQEAHPTVAAQKVASEVAASLALL